VGVAHAEVMHAAGAAEGDLAPGVDVVVAQSVVRVVRCLGVNRIDTLARVATALNRHLVLSLPQETPTDLKDAVQVA